MIVAKIHPATNVDNYLKYFLSFSLLTLNYKILIQSNFLETGQKITSLTKFLPIFKNFKENAIKQTLFKKIFSNNFYKFTKKVITSSLFSVNFSLDTFVTSENTLKQTKTV